PLYSVLRQTPVARWAAVSLDYVVVLTASVTRETSTTVVVILLRPSVICCRPWKLVPCRERQLVLSMLRRCRRGAGQRGRERGRERNLGCMTSHLVSPCLLDDAWNK